LGDHAAAVAGIAPTAPVVERESVGPFAGGTVVGELERGLRCLSRNRQSESGHHDQCCFRKRAGRFMLSMFLTCTIRPFDWAEFCPDRECPPDGQDLLRAAVATRLGSNMQVAARFGRASR
jgi:hypothetical protein